MALSCYSEIKCQELKLIRHCYSNRILLLISQGKQSKTSLQIFKRTFLMKSYLKILFLHITYILFKILKKFV